MPASVVEAVASAFGAAGIDLGALGHAWARVLPVVIIVPAFGLRALPVSARAVMGLAFAAAITPGVSVLGSTSGHAAGLLDEAARGLSVAVAAAIPLWAATMAGGMIDALRGASEQVSAPTVEGRATLLGAPLSILASAIFLAGGARPGRSPRSLDRRQRRARYCSPLTISRQGSRWPWRLEPRSSSRRSSWKWGGRSSRVRPLPRRRARSSRR